MPVDARVGRSREKGKAALAAARGHGPRIWGYRARDVWRRLRRRIRVGPSYRWRYSGRTPDRVLIAPPDLRTADPQIAAEIYSGRFLLAGALVEAPGNSPFQLEVRNERWLRALHGFRWLRHMSGAGTELAAANARALVEEWMAISGRKLRGIAWEPEVVARRLIAWLQHSTIVLQGAEYPFYRAYLRMLAMQIRYLRTMAAEMPESEERLRARIALCFAALSLPMSPTVLRAATRNLAFELDQQVLPDGGHVSRNPEAVLELLADLLPLRQTYANQAEAPPPALLGAIDRMFPALRFFRHEDGSLARFNGMGAAVPDRIASVLRLDETAGAPLLHASHSGYERLALGGTTVIADTGTPTPAGVVADIHAGCLSFELSSQRQCYVVNAGVDRYGADDFRALARTTAAHSTATVNDASSCRFRSLPVSDGGFAPLISGPVKVPCRRTDGPGSHGFVASHDGYVGRFGIYHERELVLHQEGRVLDGTDRFYLKGGGAPAAKNADRIAIRFHLHPKTQLYLDEVDRLVIAGANGEGWIFACDGVVPEVEESVFFAALGGPQKSRQIVLSLAASEISDVQWRFTRADLRRSKTQGGD